MSQLTADQANNLALFIAEVKELGQLWGLQYGEEWVICDSTEFEDTDVLPLWSSETYARAHCVEEWQDYHPAAISLDDFFDEWVNDLHEDGVMIGTNWNAELEGQEVDPIELAKELARVDD